MYSINRKIILLTVTLILTTKASASESEVITVTPTDLLLTEHVMSLFKNKVPKENKDQIENEVINIISNSIRDSCPELDEEEINNKAWDWLNKQLEDLKTQDKEDYPEFYQNE